MANTTITIFLALILFAVWWGDLEDYAELAESVLPIEIEREE